MSPKAKLASLLGAVRSSKGRALGWWLLCLWGTRILGSELGGLHVLILGYIDWAHKWAEFFWASRTHLRLLGYFGYPTKMTKKLK